MLDQTVETQCEHISSTTEEKNTSNENNLTDISNKPIQCSKISTTVPFNDAVVIKKILHLLNDEI